MKMVQSCYCMQAKIKHAKVSYNTIGWVKSARASNGWVTSLSYARDCAPKALINSAGRFLIVNLKLHQYLPLFLQSCFNEICKMQGYTFFLFIHLFCQSREQKEITSKTLIVGNGPNS